MSNLSVRVSSTFDRYSDEGLFSAVNNTSSPGENLCVSQTNPSALRFVYNTELQDRARRGLQLVNVETNVARFNNALNI